jgi:hypothetical protein
VQLRRVLAQCLTAHPVSKFPPPPFEFSASGNDPHTGDRHLRRAVPAPRCLEAVMNCDPRCALNQELEAKQTLLDQLRALAVEDPDFFTDLIEGETNLLEHRGPRRLNPRRRKLADGAKAALDKLQARQRSAENRSELKRRLLAHTQQYGLKTLRTPTATLSLAEASVKAIAVAHEDIPARWWKPHRRNSIRTASPRRSAPARKRSRRPRPSRTRRNARPALAEIEALHPLIPGVTASNGGITLIRRV